MTIGGNLTNWFQIRVGVCEGYILSPTLFNIFLDFVMKGVDSLHGVLNMSEDMTLDIHYVDDTTSRSTVFKKLEIATNELKRHATNGEIKINAQKCKSVSLMRSQLWLDNEVIENCESFEFLRIQRHLVLASQAVGCLRK